MAQPLTVKVSSRYQISLPSSALQQLNIEAGDRLLVDVQDGMIILLPQHESAATSLAGLHRHVWQGIDTDAYLGEERDAWRD